MIELIKTDLFDRWLVGLRDRQARARIEAMDPDHYRLRFFPHRDAETFTVGIDAEWTDEQPGELANYTPSYESGSSDCQPGEVTISDDGLLSVMPRQRSASHVVIRTGWTAQLPPEAVEPIRRAIALAEAKLSREAQA